MLEMGTSVLRVGVAAHRLQAGGEGASPREHHERVLSFPPGHPAAVPNDRILMNVGFLLG